MTACEAEGEEIPTQRKLAYKGAGQAKILVSDT